MSEETISGTGRYPALGSADLATPYRAPGLAARPGADATPASQVVAEPAKLAAVQPAKQPSAEEINSAIAVANANLSSSNRTLDYRVDAVTGISIAMIRNSQTGVVVATDARAPTSLRSPGCWPTGHPASTCCWT